MVIEEYLDGPEVSLFAVADGRTAVPLLAAQDFKRAGDGDQGPNTGGMGAYTPLPWAPGGLTDEVMATVVQPAIDELARRGTPYRGLLYAGLALTGNGVKVVEFNARFGDPETQVVLDRLATPLAGLLHASAVGDLGSVPALAWHPGAAVTVVIAARGLPGGAGQRRRDHRRGTGPRRATRLPAARGDRPQRDRPGDVRRPRAQRGRLRDPTWRPPAPPPTRSRNPSSSEVAGTAVTSRSGPAPEADQVTPGSPPGSRCSRRWRGDGGCGKRRGARYR